MNGSPYPRMFTVRQTFDTSCLDDVSVSTHQALREHPGIAQLRGNVAIAVGSRGIADLTSVVRATVDEIQRQGASPFIVPAMGSHGGATDQGQRDVLNSLGISEVSMGCPIKSSMQTRKIGRIEEHGIDLHFSSDALDADHVVLINRVKPHTRLYGAIESGLFKLWLIGLGKHTGAAAYHGWFGDCDYQFDGIVRLAAPILRDRTPVRLGIGLIENSRKQLKQIEVVSADQIPHVEPRLLTTARLAMPGLPVEQVDLLVVDQMGKEISGTGFDTNVVGRKRNDLAAIGDEKPSVREIYVRALTEATAGNASGIGLAVYAHQNLVDSIDPVKTRINCITAGHASAGAIPLAFPNDQSVFDAARNQSAHRKVEDLRWMRIRNTLSLDRVWMSEAYWDAMQSRSDVEIMGPPQPIRWNPNGDFLDDVS
jgi:Domain of unknown function (DUF362)